MKLICDCGNEGEFYKLGTIDGETAETCIDEEAFEITSHLSNKRLETMYTLCVCKECGRRIYF